MYPGCGAATRGVTLWVWETGSPTMEDMLGCLPTSTGDSRKEKKQRRGQDTETEREMGCSHEGGECRVLPGVICCSHGSSLLL